MADVMRCRRSSRHVVDPSSTDPVLAVGMEACQSSGTLHLAAANAHYALDSSLLNMVKHTGSGLAHGIPPICPMF